MITGEFKRTKLSCYFAYLSMSSIFSLPPMLFITFHNMYNISFTLLGTLVLVNFCTQLGVDLVFSFFSKHFNIKKTVRVMPVLTTIGMGIYALSPVIFKDNIYIGLVIGTVIFSVSAGLSEVLLSPVVAAIPGSTDKDMSLLHSLYAWGVVTVVGISSLFFVVFGKTNWMYLTLFWAVLPLIACVSFCLSPFPQMDISHTDSKAPKKNRAMGLLLCVGCIFFGSAAENSMTNWISSYMESALQIPKTVGDIVGMAVFAVLLGLGRVLYAKYGKNISNVLLAGMAGAVVCYLIAGLSDNVVLSFMACIVTGMCTSMLWPGTLILMEEKIPSPGVAAYALMAAGGDFGASVAPQLIGIVVDKVSESTFAVELCSQTGVSIEQISMKSGMLVASIFPVIGVLLLLFVRKYFNKGQNK
ncbi:MAG: MFS transporter [Clostridia bacterium]|nr:MFS transporter [Clostridia bacterium]